MLTSCIAFVSALALQAEPTKLDMKASSASLFKNGYAVVVREAPVSGGEYIVEEFPNSVLGTMWITASTGVKLKSVVSTWLQSETQTPATNMDEVLAANVGRVLSLVYNEVSYTIKLLSVAGNIIIGETRPSENAQGGEIVILQKGGLQRIHAAGDLVWQVKRSSQKRVMRIVTEAPRPGKLFIVSLERGMTWAPSYAVDISNEKSLSIVSKAIIMNDLIELNNIEVRLVTGFPNIPFINYRDPFAVSQSVDEFTGALMQMGTPDAMRRQAGAAMGQLANKAAERFAEAWDVSTLPGITEEDLFFYRLPAVMLKRGDRGYYVLFQSTSEYEHIYELEVPDIIADPGASADAPRDVWHSLKFKNNSGQPWTTAPVITVKDGEILGQDMMFYTSPGADAVVKITKAMDVRAEDAEEETARERNAQNYYGTVYDLVTLKGTIRIINRKTVPVKLEIDKFITGEITDTSPTGKVTSMNKGLRAVNRNQRIEWTLDLKPGEKLEVAYTYRVYVTR